MNVLDLGAGRSVRASCLSAPNNGGFVTVNLVGGGSRFELIDPDDDTTQSYANNADAFLVGASEGGLFGSHPVQAEERLYMGPANESLLLHVAARFRFGVESHCFVYAARLAP